MGVFLVSYKERQMKKLKKTEIRVLELFGKDELAKFKELDMKTRTRYLIYYRSFRSCEAKIYSPSEWLESRKYDIRANNETARMILDKFDISEFELYKGLKLRDRVNYGVYYYRMRESNKQIMPPSEWYQRVLEKRDKFPNVAGKYTRLEKKSAKKEMYSNEIQKKPFDMQVVELFSTLELEFFNDMIPFAKKYYKKHLAQNLKAGFQVKKPSEWYIEFIATTQCVEMLRLQNRFFGLVKREISRQDAKEYIAYFEAMAYQRERNCCL